MSEDTEVSSSYAQRVGEQLRSVRKRKRLSLQAVEASSNQEFKASVLGAYERGERAISVPRLQRLAGFYQVPVDHLLPKDTSAPSWAQKSVIDLTRQEPTQEEPNERITVDLEKLEALEVPEQDVLSRYLGMIQVRRQDFNGRMLTVRQEDIGALAILFETTPDIMRRRLNDLGLCLRS